MKLSGLLRTPLRYILALRPLVGLFSFSSYGQKTKNHHFWTLLDDLRFPHVLIDDRPIRRHCRRGDHAGLPDNNWEVDVRAITRQLSQYLHKSAKYRWQKTRIKLVLKTTKFLFFNILWNRLYWLYKLSLSSLCPLERFQNVNLSEKSKKRQFLVFWPYLKNGKSLTDGLSLKMYLRGVLSNPQSFIEIGYSVWLQLLPQNDYENAKFFTTSG